MLKKFAAALGLVLLAVILGGLAGALTAGFLRLVEWAQQLVWEALPRLVNLPAQTVLVCALGGLLVGVCQRYLGDHPQNINEAVRELLKTGRLDYAHLPHGLATVSVSLVFGASLGPESAIMDLAGGLGTWVGDQLDAARQRLGWPRPARSDQRWVNVLNAWPGWIALAAGGLAFVRTSNGMYSGGLLHLSQRFQWSDLLWSVPLAGLGAAGGWLFLQLQTWTRAWVAPLSGRLILRGALGGLALGLVASFLPLTLFSGQHALQTAYDQAALMGFGLLFLIALARLFLTNFLLAAGWKGGQFLPLMFGGAALGLAVSVLFPAVPAAAAVLAVMAALTAVVLPQPLIALVLMALLFPLEYIGVTLVAVGLVQAGKIALRRRQPG